MAHFAVSVLVISTPILGMFCCIC
uniref:Uncharacterized protein n=1 Tax=Arundo donax TaxID=35708 RepID=A0A0A8YVU8_ARUDO